MNRYGTSQVRHRTAAIGTDAAAVTRSRPEHRAHSPQPLPLRHNVPMRPTASSAPGRPRADIDLTNLWAPIPGQQAHWAGRGPDGVEILLVGDGPHACTSGRVLDRVYIYDVNRFYAALGVDPRAERHTLGAAYVARDGHTDPVLTEIIKILLDQVRRAVYDRLIPLQRFQTREIWEARVRAAADLQFKSGIPLSSVFEPQNPYFEAPNMQESDLEHAQEPPRITVEVTPEPWGYAFYLWGVIYTASAVTHLPQWQQMIITALGEDEDEGEPPMRFAVGRSALGSSPAAIEVGGTPVAFLSAGTAPQPNLARHVARQLRALVTAKTLQAPETPKALSHANPNPGAAP